MKKLLLFIVLAALLIPAVSYAEVINVQIEGSKGKLAAVIQKPKVNENNKCAMVMLLHGFASNKEFGLFKLIADELEKNNIASIRFDFNGHGKSEGRFEDMTVLNEIEDARKVFDYVRNLDYVDSISIAGHSQGGVVASMLAGELGADKMSKVVLFAPAAVLRDDAIRGTAFGVNYDAATPPETVKIFGNLNLGRDYILTAQKLKIYDTAEKFTGPVCLIHGTGDRLVPYTYSERYNKIYTNSELHLLDGVDHGFNSHWEEAAKTAVDFLMR